MNILIITTYYPPDTAIAAVRPYMLAKYLSDRNTVTVIRSGIINKTADGYYKPLASVEVISYMGSDSPAELFDRGEEPFQGGSGNARGAFIPEPLRKKISALYYRSKKWVAYFQRRKVCEERLKQLKKTIDSLRDREYDVVFSTYGELENIYAGEYAAQVFHCKWVMDFRDPIAQKSRQHLWEYLLYKREEEQAIEKADLCTVVSDEMFSSLRKRYNKIVTVHNGFDDSEENPEDGAFNRTFDSLSEKPLTICYTGQLYEKRSEGLDVLSRVFSELIENQNIKREKIRFCYAGNGSNEARRIMQKHNLGSIFLDFGYLSKTETVTLQMKSDIFLVLSWNTKHEKGVLTGKFYEGLHVRKPILAIITGEEPNSELLELNKKHPYGVCIETSNANHLKLLSDYILKEYKEKEKQGSLSFSPSEETCSLFSYKQIASYLENELKNLLNEKSAAKQNCQ